MSFGETYVQGMLARFAAPHAALVVDLRLTDAYVDLASEGIDLAFRVGEGAVSALKRRRLGALRSRVVASPAYLDAHGAPETPADLGGHACIVDTNRADPGRWSFDKDGAGIAVEVPSRFRVNSAKVARDLAVAGHGIAFCPAFVLGDDLETGRLVPLLPGYDSPAHALSAVWLEGRTLPRKVRALIDFAVEDARRNGLG